MRMSPSTALTAALRQVLKTAGDTPEKLIGDIVAAINKGKADTRVNQFPSPSAGEPVLDPSPDLKPKPVPKAPADLRREMPKSDKPKQDDDKKKGGTKRESKKDQASKPATRKVEAPAPVPAAPPELRRSPSRPMTATAKLQDALRRLRLSGTKQGARSSPLPEISLRGSRAVPNLGELLADARVGRGVGELLPQNPVGTLQSALEKTISEGEAAKTPREAAMAATTKRQPHAVAAAATTKRAPATPATAATARTTGDLASHMASVLSPIDIDGPEGSSSIIRRGTDVEVPAAPTDLRRSVKPAPLTTSIFPATEPVVVPAAPADLRRSVPTTSRTGASSEPATPSPATSSRTTASPTTRTTRLPPPPPPGGPPPPTVRAPKISRSGLGVLGAILGGGTALGGGSYALYKGMSGKGKELAPQGQAISDGALLAGIGGIGALGVGGYLLNDWFSGKKKKLEDEEEAEEV